MVRIERLACLAALAAGTLATAGCSHGERIHERADERGERYRNLVDPSWPERYNHVARLETLAPFQVQAQNGQYLDQTVWNYHFEPATDKLTAAGVERLDYLVRKRSEYLLFVHYSTDMCKKDFLLLLKHLLCLLLQGNWHW